MLKVIWKSGSVWLSQGQVSEGFLTEWLHRIKQLDGGAEIRIEIMDATRVPKLYSEINNSVTLRKLLSDPRIQFQPSRKK